jgi:hypothetical protein
VQFLGGSNWPDGSEVFASAGGAAILGYCMNDVWKLADVVE